MSIEKVSFYDLNYSDLELLLIAEGHNKSQASLLYNHIYKMKAAAPCKHHNLSPRVQKYLEDNIDFTLPSIDYVFESNDQTVKFLVKLSDDLKVEMVIIPFQNKYTLCLSSQVGCAMKCSFCYTGTQGLKRHLKTSEIITQFLLAWNWLKTNRPDDHQIKNIVFMGQGEPLHNFDNVKKACEIFKDQHGMSIGVQKITISTAGYLPGLKRWNDEIPGVNLALSLHAVDEEKRNKLIPINARYPLSEIMDYIKTIPLSRKQYIIYEYLLIDDFNDTKEDADLCGQMLQGTQSIINLIPFNPFPGSEYKKSKEENIDLFKKTIENYGLPALVRTTKGDDILAACGQLNTKV